jgi:hypothetical protein
MPDFKAGPVRAFGSRRQRRIAFNCAATSLHKQGENSWSHPFPRQRDSTEAGWMSPGAWSSSESGARTCSCFSASSSYDVRLYGLVVKLNFIGLDLRASPLSAYCRGAALVVSRVLLPNRRQGKRSARPAAIQKTLRHSRVPYPRAWIDNQTRPGIGVKGERANSSLLCGSCVATGRARIQHKSPSPPRSGTGGPYLFTFPKIYL